MTALNFKSTSQNAEKYGDRYWVIGLADGRELSCYGSSVRVVDGALVVDAGMDENEQYPMLTLAAGQWVHAYAASVMDGSPVIVDELPDPES